MRTGILQNIRIDFLYHNFYNLYTEFLRRHLRNNQEEEHYKFAFRLYPDVKCPQYYGKIYLTHQKGVVDFYEDVTTNLYYAYDDFNNALESVLGEFIDSEGGLPEFLVMKLMPELEDPDYPGFKEYNISLVDSEFMSCFNPNKGDFGLASSISHLGRYRDEETWGTAPRFLSTEFMKDMPYLEAIQEFGQYPFFLTDKGRNLLDQQDQHNAEGLFSLCTHLKCLPENLFEGCQSCESLYEFCLGCISLEEVPDNIFEPIKDQITALDKAFDTCIALKTIPEIKDMPNLATVEQMCSGCESLQGCNLTEDKIAISPDIFQNCPKLSYFDSCFQGCHALQSIAGFGNTGLNPVTIHGTPVNEDDDWCASLSFNEMFCYCSSLKFIPPLWEQKFYRALLQDQHYDVFTGCTSAGNYNAAIQHGWANS